MERNIMATASVLTSLGFEEAKNTTIMQRLNRLSPSGETALRDSVAAGLGLVLKMNNILGQLGTSQIFNFVHIVITDGSDTCSKNSLQELSALFYLINRTIPKARCSTVFIGIDLDKDEAIELVVLKQFGGDNCQVYNASNINLGNIFERISVSLGISQQYSVAGATDGRNTSIMVQQRNVPMLQLRKNHFAVLLNLDFSGSMEGNRWESLKRSVNMFINNLNPGDFISCLLFNSTVRLLNQIPLPAVKTEVSSPRNRVIISYRSNSENESQNCTIS